MRLAAAILVSAALAAAAPARAQLSLQRPDDGINTPQASDDPMLDAPVIRSAQPEKPKPQAKPKAPASSGPAAAKPKAGAKPFTATSAAPVTFRQCADSYFAGASLLRANPDAVDTLLQRAQIAGERQLRLDPDADRTKFVEAIKMSGLTRAAEIRALDDEAGPKAAQALFRTIRQCDAKLNLAVTGALVFNAQGRGMGTAPARP
jgi:hypothetical protein